MAAGRAERGDGRPRQPRVQLPEQARPSATRGASIDLPIPQVLPRTLTDPSGVFASEADWSVFGDESIQRVQRGDERAKAALMTEILPLVTRYARGRLGRQETALGSADDVAMEIVTAVLGALPKYETRGFGFSFRAFVYGIASHKVTDAFRAIGRNKSEPMAELPDVPTLLRDGPEQRVVDGELADRMGLLLHTLTPRQREVLVCRIVQGLSAEETAHIVGSTPGAVRVTQHRALNRLRAIITDPSTESEQKGVAAQVSERVASVRPRQRVTRHRAYQRSTPQPRLRPPEPEFRPVEEQEEDSTFVAASVRPRPTDIKQLLDEPSHDVLRLVGRAQGEYHSSRSSYDVAATPKPPWRPAPRDPHFWALRFLSPDELRVVEPVFIQGMRTQDVASALGYTASQVSGVIVDVRGSLQAMLGDETDLHAAMQGGSVPVRSRGERERFERSVFSSLGHDNEDAQLVIDAARGMPLSTLAGLYDSDRLRIRAKIGRARKTVYDALITAPISAQQVGHAEIKAHILQEGVPEAEPDVATIRLVEFVTALQLLAPYEQRVLYEKYIKNLSNDAIVRTLRMTPTAVDSNLKRGKDFLEELTRSPITLPDDLEAITQPLGSYMDWDAFQTKMATLLEPDEARLLRLTLRGGKNIYRSLGMTRKDYLQELLQIRRKMYKNLLREALFQDVLLADVATDTAAEADNVIVFQAPPAAKLVVNRSERGTTYVIRAPDQSGTTAPVLRLRTGYAS